MKVQQKKKTNLIVICILLSIPIAMFIKYYINDQAFGNADFVQYFSSKKYFGQCLLNGEFPEWNKYLAGGMPQGAVTDFYLVSTLLSLLPLKEYIYAFFIIHLFFGSYFFYLYLKECECDTKIALTMAVIFECSVQINGARKSHPAVVAAICIFPLTMFCIKKFFNTKYTKWLYISALTSALQLTIGMQYGSYADIIVVIFLLMTGFSQKYPISYMLKKGITWFLIYLGGLAYFLLPTVNIMQEYSARGTTNPTFETFCSYSLHPIKLIQMIFPRFFSNIYQAFGIQYSSEMDIELYLGIFVLALALSSVCIYKKIYIIKIDLICGLFALAYSMLGHIPYLNQIVYKLPVLGGFRCSSRMLYIFFFFVFTLAAKAMNELKQEQCYYKILRFLKKFTGVIFILSVILIVSATFIVCLLNEESQALELLKTIKEVFMIPTIVSGIIMIESIILMKNDKKVCLETELGYRQIIICVSVLLITLIEILPFSLYTDCTELSEMSVSDEITQTLQNEGQQYKVWDAFGNVDGAHESLISQNKSIIKGIPAINSYTAYNNPFMFKYFKNLGNNVKNIPFSYSGLLTGSQNVSDNLIYQNDVLSMLGVKYIIDSSNVIENSGGISIDCTSEGQILIENEIFEIDCMNDQIGVVNLLDGIEADTLYKITFKILGTPTFLTVDLYGGEAYDNAAQEEQLVVGEAEYIAYLYSDNIDVATEDIYLRVMAKGESEIKITDCTVSKLNTEETYEYYATDKNGTKIYINNNAKDLLYFPEKVEYMDSYEDLYVTKNNYNVDQVAYTACESFELGSGTQNILIKNYTSNVLNATVEAEDKSYLCFSQCYSKNWTVYIDDIPYKPDLVNGIIMGIEVPAGVHEITFKYSDYMYNVGFLITVVVCLGVMLYCIKNKEKIDKELRK